MKTATHNGKLVRVVCKSTKNTRIQEIQDTPHGFVRVGETYLVPTQEIHFHPDFPVVKKRRKTTADTRALLSFPEVFEVHENEDGSFLVLDNMTNTVCWSQSGAVAESIVQKLNSNPKLADDENALIAMGGKVLGRLSLEEILNKPGDNTNELEAIFS